MIRPPLIGIRFTGLDQRCAGWSRCIAYICKESGSLRTWVCQAVWPTISFPSQSHRPAITHSARGQREFQAHTYGSFHVQAKLWSEDLHIDTFHGLLAPWQWRNRTAEIAAVWREETNRRGGKAVVNGGGVDMGIREQGVCHISWIHSPQTQKPAYTDSHTKYKHKIQAHTLVLVGTNALCQCASCFRCVFVKWRTTSCHRICFGKALQFVLTLSPRHELADSGGQWLGAGGWGGLQCCAEVMAVARKREWRGEKEQNMGTCVCSRNASVFPEGRPWPTKHLPSVLSVAKGWFVTIKLVER